MKVNTWGELLDILDAEGWGNDEYLSAYAPYTHPGKEDGWRAQELWEVSGQRWIACYWVVGDSEGYYAHIDRIFQRNGVDSRELMILAKFWDADRAAAFAARAQKLVNDSW